MINPRSFVGVLDLMFLGFCFLKLQERGNTLNSQGFVKISKITNRRGSGNGKMLNHKRYQCNCLCLF